MSLLQTTLTLAPESLSMVDKRARCSAILSNSGYDDASRPDLNCMIGLTSHLGLNLKGTRP